MGRVDRRTFIKTSAGGLSGLGIAAATGCSDNNPNADAEVVVDTIGGDGGPDHSLGDGGTDAGRDGDASSQSDKRANFIVVFCDDMGYGDTTRTGHPTIRTPNCDRLADQGVTMTQFYSAAPVCSPSRAALLTGRYPVRTGISRVLHYEDEVGLPDTEITLAELLKAGGYSTACIGKWHLGDVEGYWPTEQGFDYFFGVPCSNMDTTAPGIDIPLMRMPPNAGDDVVLELDVDQSTLTQRYTEEAVAFIEESKDVPFFLYLPHTMPHLPLHVSPNFEGHSKAGTYGDAIEEIDWSLGQMMDKLSELGLTENTFLVFTSDNGPYESIKSVGGSTGLFSGKKGETKEGGMREPCIISYPTLLKGGQVNMEVGTTMDLFVTISNLASDTTQNVSEKIQMPTDRTIDGKDILPMLQGKESSPHQAFCYFRRKELEAIRMGPYKLHLGTLDGTWVSKNELYNVELDPSEFWNLVDPINHGLDSDLPTTGDVENKVNELREEANAIEGAIRDLEENKEILDTLCPEAYVPLPKTA